MRALRSVLSQRGYAALAILTLALAVGANLVVFSLVNAIWLRPDPVPNVERLVVVLGDDGRSGAGDSYAITEYGLESNLRTSGAFAGVAGQVLTSGFDAGFKPRMTIATIGHPVEMIGVTSDYFSVLGLTIRGRDFTRDDDAAGADPVAIISDRLWRTSLANLPDVIGSQLDAAPVPIRIVGIAPPGFEGARLGEHADLWIPSKLSGRVASIAAQDIGRQAPPLLAIARLRQGLSAPEAERLVAEHVSSSGRRPPVHLSVVPLRQIFGAPDSRTIVIREEIVVRVVAASAALVLLAGSVTLMALVLAHYERRRQELSVRLALGATGGRLARQLAAELGWISAAGAGVALLVASWGLRVFPALSLPGGIDLSRLELRIDWTVAIGGVVFATASLIAAAILPIRRFTRPDLARGLVTSTVTPSSASHRIRRVLLTVHVAATIVLLVAAGLFVRSVIYGFTAGPGFDVDRTLFVDLQTAAPYIRSDHDQEAMALRRAIAERRLIESLDALPGVETVALGAAPIGADQAWQLQQPLTLTVGGSSRSVRFVREGVSADYLDALGVTVVRGRPFLPGDAGASPKPALVTESLARQLWPGGDPLGRNLTIGTETTVVGVIPDVAFGSFSLPHSSAVLLPTTVDLQARSFSLGLVVRTARPEQSKQAVSEAIATSFPNAPRVDVATGRELVARDLGRERLGAWFFSAFGIVTLALAVSGVFGLVAYLAESRRREFGVRIALGATAGNLLRQAINAGLRPVLTGTAVGLALAAVLTRIAVSVLLGVSRLDPISYGAAALVMIGAALSASAIAAWRLRRLTPIDALRADA